MSKAALIPECKKDIGGVKEDICVPANEKKEGAISLYRRLLRLDTFSKRNTLDSPTEIEPQATYYGVYIPCEIKKGPDEETIHVYTDKLEALELFRRYKSARFKAFRNRQDAMSFALRGAEPIDNHEGNGNSIMGEKPYPFKAPSPQDMVTLRKAIEAGKVTVVRDRIWDNPRYLVSSGSTPAIVQEGSRYNALHIAAKALNAEICNLILTTVGNPAFVQTLYGMETDYESCKEFATILLDRYLNTPDKAMNETPLHFAAKFGGDEVVDVLTSFPQCNKMAKNKYGEMAKDIICNRCTSNAAASRISSLLQDRYYVPVLQTEDGSGAPAVGRPFTPKEPPDLNPDPLSPRYEIFAFAGPMDSQSAEGFRRRWKTPPRGGFRLKDISKGLEAVGRNLAEEMQIGWKEYWAFLDTFTDLRSKEGLDLLESYLKTKYETAFSLAYNDSVNTNHELSMSRISLGNLSHNSQLDTALSPISELCVAMKTCRITDEASNWRRCDRTRRVAPPRTHPNGDSPQPINQRVSQLLCIERTCQVFAKRIADALVFSITAEPEVAGESLKSEAKHLQHTIHTYMGDERFKEINFALIHSRLAQLVVFNLTQKTKDADDMNYLIDVLGDLRCLDEDVCSSDSERKPIAYRNNRGKDKHATDGHVRCVSGFICDELADTARSKPPAGSDVECVEIWKMAAGCSCSWQIDVFERSGKRNSFRKNRSNLSTSSKNDSFIRRLTYDYDIGDGKLQNSEVQKPLSVNSPAGDNLYTLDVAKCQVVEAEISDDESVASCQSDSDAYETAENDSDDDMQDASDRAVTEPFIYGEEPSKMDRLVYDAISSCEITADEYPSVYRWRHCVALYPKTERESWRATTNLDESVSSMSWTVGESPRTNRPRCSTPHKDRDIRDTRDSHADKTLPLQVSNWLRVTGPNSPRSALVSKNVNQNVSFGF
ncbi:ankyrin repeat and LEM domain-containing protein 2 homolog [Danaus plexippus]|uniref:ankyrin repeat and LEM domain-containing protein 2 homolog n=1 Tax=Danaus plexippus TaxID=13037 RepID=UPI002AB1EA68|nr:ankyrin repeat and LEM domain-containing protein 2 homolog [Danaus plexippus]